jgi:hypothetical protein
VHGERIAAQHHGAISHQIGRSLFGVGAGRLGDVADRRGYDKCSYRMARVPARPDVGLVARSTIQDAAAGRALALASDQSDGALAAGA